MSMADEQQGERWASGPTTEGDEYQVLHLTTTLSEEHGTLTIHSLYRWSVAAARQCYAGVYTGLGYSWLLRQACGSTLSHGAPSRQIVGEWGSTAWIIFGGPASDSASDALIRCDLLGSDGSRVNFCSARLTTGIFKLISCLGISNQIFGSIRT